MVWNEDSRTLEARRALPFNLVAQDHGKVGRGPGKVWQPVLNGLMIERQETEPPKVAATAAATAAAAASRERDPGGVLARLFPFLLPRKFPDLGISAVGESREECRAEDNSSYFLMSSGLMGDGHMCVGPVSVMFPVLLALLHVRF